MAIKFSELRGLLKDTNIQTVKMSDPAYNIQLMQCTNNYWNATASYIGMVNFFNLNKLKSIGRLDVTCLFCPSEINLWISTRSFYQPYQDNSYAYLVFRYEDMINLNLTLNKYIPNLNKNKKLLSLFYVTNPVNGGALSEKNGVEKEYRGARIMNYGSYFGSTKQPKDRIAFNDIIYGIVPEWYHLELIFELNPKIIKQKSYYNVLIGLGYKPDDNFTYNDRCDLSFWLDYGTSNNTYSMFETSAFNNNIHKDYRYSLDSYFEYFNSKVIYE